MAVTKTLADPNVQKCTHCQYLINTTDESYLYLEDNMEEEGGDMHYFCTHTCLIHWLVDQIEEAA